MTELLTDPGHTRQDLRQINAAIRKGWLIPDQLLDALPKVIGTIALKGKPRDQVAAAKVLIAMKEQNDDEQPAASRQTVVNVGVNVDNRTDDQPLTAIQFAQRYREARLSRRVE